MQIFVRSFIEQNTNMPVLKTRVSLKYMNGNQDMIKTSSDDNLLLRDNSNCYSLIRKLSVRRRLKKPTAVPGSEMVAKFVQ